ncbi:hypothetical protein LV82_02103 [Albidovulum inexpectatum]|uniref:Beta-barrel assembly complex subunit BamF n=1 Tax=Albidovulum inexpectatum TaxID=196587 RepID=A0A2S5JFM4_9RHOB|nr:hypothetical protein [Albidovulum inexpectatum]PPB80229.1 hypothetical protein LV82_02103 [Albidovulum inexpectatum]
MPRKFILTCLLFMLTGCSVPGARKETGAPWPRLVPLSDIEQAAPATPADDPTGLLDRAAALKARAASLQGESN